jgi:CheY-like chemotaxis protein
VTGERILVVDDMADIRDAVIDHILKPYAYDYLEAGNGLEALEKIKSNPPDLILTDLRMPQLDGIGLLHKLREENINIPVILMTSFGSEEIAIEVFRLGVRDYVTKPFTEKELLPILETALAETRLRHQRDELTQSLAAANKGLKNQVQQLETLYKIGKEIVGISDADTLMTRTMEIVGKLTNADEASLFLLDSDNDTLVARAVKKGDEVSLSIDTVENKLVREVIEADEPRVGEPRPDETFEDFTVEVCVPMHVGSTVGALCVTMPADAITEHLLSLLNALVVYVAASLERARLTALLAAK